MANIMTADDLSFIAFLTIAAVFWGSIIMTKGNALAVIGLTIVVAFLWIPILNLAKYGEIAPF